MHNLTPSPNQDNPISQAIVISRDEHGIDAKELCPNATEVVERLQKADYEAYIVGGSVRDLLLGKSPKDYDIATSATPEQVREVFPRCRLIGRRFRLAHVRMHGTLLEVATFRGQSGNAEAHQSDEGRILRDNVWGSLEEDAVRRDFTINALFMDPVSGEIRDFVGGYEDLKNRRLRLIGDPETRYREDPVRLLRAARFVAKLGVELDPATEAAMADVAPGLEQIPPARMFEEVCKLYLTGHAEQTMEALQRYGLTRYLLPLLAPGDAPGEAMLHPVMRRAMQSTDRRLAEGKSVTPAFLVAALLWEPVEDLAARYEEDGISQFQSMEHAGEEVLAEQVKRTAIPRRFSTVTRQIWLNQTRLTKTRGKRALSILRQPRFRAAYDFLLLRAEDEPSLQELAEFWTEVQKDETLMPPATERTAQRRPRKRRRRRGPPRGSPDNG